MARRARTQGRRFVDRGLDQLPELDTPSSVDNAMALGVQIARGSRALQDTIGSLVHEGNYREAVKVLYDNGSPSFKRYIAGGEVNAALRAYAQSEEFQQLLGDIAAQAPKATNYNEAGTEDSRGKTFRLDP